MPSPRSRSPCRRTPQTQRATPRARRSASARGVRLAGLVGGDRDRRHRVMVVHRGPLHREHRQRLCPGRHRGAEPAHRGRRGRHQGCRQPARPRRRSADRAGSDRLARPAGPGHRRRCRGRRPRWRQRSGRSPSSRPRSMPPRPPSSRRRPSRRGPAPMPAAPDRWWPSGWASRQANDQAIADSRKADAAVVAAQAQKAAAEQQLDVLKAQVVQARARQQNAAAAVQLAREQPRLHRDPCAVRRHRRQPRRGAGPACHAGHPAHRRRAAARTALRRRQLQGDAASPHAARA